MTRSELTTDDILKIVPVYGTITIMQIIQRKGCSWKTAKTKLNELIDNGSIEEISIMGEYHYKRKKITL
jgi:predicted transcriptional regulator